MQNGKIRFEGKTTTMVNIATLIEFHEVQNQRWQVQVSSGSIGSTFHPLMNENCDAEKAKLSIMQSIKTVIERNQQLIWIDVPDVNGCLARLHGDAAMAVLSDLQAHWTCAVDNRVQIMADVKRPNTNIDKHDARNAYIELIRTDEQSKQALLIFYSESHEQEAGESDDDYFTRCAQQDFEDGPSGCLFHSHFATAHAHAEMLKTQRIEKRVAIANAEFDQYEFGGGITVSDFENWNTNDVTDLTKIVYITCDDDAPDADSERVSFHVRFCPDGTVDDAYGLLMRNGSDIGVRPSNRTVMEAISETWSSEH